MKFTTGSGLAYVTHDTYVVVLNLSRIEEQQSPYVFEGPAFEIWTRIDGTRTEEQVVDELVEASGADREVVARDAHEFIAQLLELGLIEEVPD
ncbi:MAG: PqqD family protein [Demequina sp.]|nr:PqqD family protein [Demequina sp.]